jgi:hypothetical protein
VIEPVWPGLNIQSEQIVVHTAVPVVTDKAQDFNLVDLPELPRYAREVTIQFDSDNPGNWIHEFQIPITR